MHRYLFHAAACCLMFSTIACASEPANDEDQILSLERDWVRAVVDEDRGTLNELLDESYVEMGAHGARRAKRDVLAAAPPPATSTQTLEDIQIRVNGDTAIVTGVNRYRASPVASVASVRFTDVFERRDGRWRVVASQLGR
jgi:ketosteroid isomerase-like protein